MQAKKILVNEYANKFRPRIAVTKPPFVGRSVACVQPPPPLGKNRGERRLCFTVDNRVQRPRDFFTDLWKMI